MKFKSLSGRTVNLPNIHRHRVDWEGDSLSDFQAEVKDFLCPYWKHDVVFEEMPVAGTRMRFDFLNLSKRIIVEVNGAAHLSPHSHFHRGSPARYRKQLHNDMKKAEWAQLNGFAFVEVEPSDMPLSVDWFKSQYGITL